MTDNKYNVKVKRIYVVVTSQVNGSESLSDQNRDLLAPSISSRHKKFH
jgi:hypothetical protein